MGSFIAQQPNGLYCRFSTIVDTVTHYNMTKDDYIEVCKNRCRQSRRVKRCLPSARLFRTQAITRRRYL